MTTGTGGAGGSAAAGPGAGGPSPDAPAAGGATRAGDVEILDSNGNSLGSFDGQGKPVAPNILFTTSTADERNPDPGEPPAPHFVVKEYRSAHDEQGVSHTFQSIEQAIHKAEALGKSHLDGFDEHGAWHPISKGADGIWTRRQTVAERIAAAGMELDLADPPSEAPKAPSQRGDHNQATALEALRAVLKSRGDSDKQIAAVTAAALTRIQKVRKEQGLEPVVRVYDYAAPRAASPPQPEPDRPRAQERAR